MSQYNKIRDSLIDLPVTWYPALLGVLLEQAKLKNAFRTEFQTLMEYGLNLDEERAFAWRKFLRDETEEKKALTYKSASFDKKVHR